MPKGKINVSVENIFPLIKKFLYSDQEIFLRELISNATDALTKIQHLSSIGEVKGEIGELGVDIKVDKKKKTLHITDNGVGMTLDEVKKYINDVAFSGAEEFLEKYKESSKDTGIIGHFGLGFYSSFMVADKVEIITKSFKDEPAAHWICDGSPEYSLKKADKKERGTEIILHISKDSKDYLEENKITELLNKYNKFMPHPIKFGTREETVPAKEGEKEEKVTVDNIINNPNPAWTRQPADLKDEDYNQFYRELYPYQFEEPLFHIHLNVDYPFSLTGILYFPKISNDLNLQKDRIQLYQNQVFVTDNVEGIVPEFLGLLKGVIDSPDIPLNVSRSYLQSDTSVKKITNYITRKVADKIGSIFKGRSQSRPALDYLDEQDLSRFSEQDIILETEDQIQEFLPEVLGQALARTWIDKRFLEAFYEYPEEILERGGVYLPDHISVEFMKKEKSRPKVVVYENGHKKRRKILELKLIMVAEE